MNSPSKFLLASLISLFKTSGVGIGLLVAMVVLLATYAQAQLAPSEAPIAVAEPPMAAATEKPTAEVIMTEEMTTSVDMAGTEDLKHSMPLTESMEISGTGEFRSSTKVRTGFVLVLQQGSDDELKYQPVQYYNIDGQAIFEGDIVLGSFEEMENLVADITGRPGTGFATAISGSQYRWPGGVVPFTIDSALPNVARVHDAIRHWHERTRIRLVARTEEQNFVTFRPGSGCLSSVGMQEGEQFIILGPDCDRGNVIHEIGHAVGLWHEQSREDRDLFVRILWDNIDPTNRIQFTQRIINGFDIGDYDYESIMHYPTWAFSHNGQPTIVARNGAAIGQRNGLSDGDIQGVAAMYPLDSVDGFTSPPSAVSWGENRLDVFGLGADSAMYHLAWNGSQWISGEGFGRWDSLGGEFSESPDAVSWGENRLDIFAIGIDQRMYHLAWDGSQWDWGAGIGQWESLGGHFASSPSVVSWGENRLNIFGVGTDQRMYHLTWDGSQWISGVGVGQWESLGGHFASSPSVVSWGENRLDVFAVGTDQKMYHLAWDGSQWDWGGGVGQWESLGGQFILSPSVVSRDENRLDVFGLSTDREMLYLGWDGSQWISGEGIGQWESLGGEFRSLPSVVSLDENRLDIFGLGTDGTMLHLGWDGSQWISDGGVGLWESLSGEFILSPSVVSWGEDRIDIFGLGTDQAMLHLGWDGSQWEWDGEAGQWESLGGGREQ